MAEKQYKTIYTYVKTSTWASGNNTVDEGEHTFQDCCTTQT